MYIYPNIQTQLDWLVDLSAHFPEELSSDKKPKYSVYIPHIPTPPYPILYTTINMIKHVLLTSTEPGKDNPRKQPKRRTRTRIPVETGELSIQV